MTKLSDPSIVGLGTGLAFYLHAMIPHSNAWPLLWPAAAGVIGVLLATRTNGKMGFWRSLGVGLKAGAVAGATFFVATGVSLFMLSSPNLNSLARQLGADGPINLTLAVLVSLAIAAVIGAVLSVLSAGAAYPLARARA